MSLIGERDKKHRKTQKVYRDRKIKRGERGEERGGERREGMGEERGI